MQTGTQFGSEQASQAGDAPAGAKSAQSPSAGGASVLSAADGTHPKQRIQAIRNATIMIVADDPVIVETLKNALRDAGCRSFLDSSDATRALQLLSDEKPDLVLLDVNAPQASGLDILNGIRGDDALKHIPAIVLTEATDSATKLLALGLGAADVLGKPVDPSELALRVRNTLKASVHQDQLLNFDELTGLPNRGLFMKRFAGTLARAGQRSGQCALLLLGLDSLQKLNESQGWEIGDALLTAVVAALDGHTRDSGLPGMSRADDEGIALSRVGGDAFAFVIPNLLRAEISDQFSRQLLSILENPPDVDGWDIQIAVSVGISVYPRDGETPDALFANAAAARAAAKKIGGNACLHYSKEHKAETLERQELEAQLRLAPSRHELFLSIQPRLEVQSGRVSGAEGSLRWKHAAWGLVAPEKYLPVAEETGLIVPVGAQALYLACALNKRWQLSGVATVCVSVNVSGRQFRDLENLVNTVRQVLEKTGLAGEFLTLKFPEAVLMENPERHVTALQSLKNLGVRLCLEHFGAGLSSMSYLRYLPIDELKVDGALSKDVPGNKDAAEVLIAAIKLAQGMGLKTIAEGIESQEQLAFLQDWGCDEFQGRLAVAQSSDWQKSVRKAAAPLDNNANSA
jgi:diguanylate cyclase (GGDEF)-like protein